MQTHDLDIIAGETHAETIPLGADATPVPWQASTAFAVGTVVTPPRFGGYYYRVTTAGTAGSSAPTFTAAIGAQVTDGGVVYAAQATTFVPKNLIGCTADMRICARRGSPPVLTLSSADAITLDAATGDANLLLTPTQTRQIVALPGGVGGFDMVITDSGGAREYAVEGRVRVRTPFTP